MPFAPQDGCMPGCDECQHHGVMDGTDVGPYGKETHTTNICESPISLRQLIHRLTRRRRG